MMRTLLLAMFAATVFCNIVLVKFSVGLPVRSLLAAGLLLFLEWRRPQAVHDAIVQCRPLLLATVYLALTGMILTLVNGYDILDAVSVVVENYLQSMVSIVLVYSLCTVLGLRAVSAVVGGVILLSVSVSILQFAGIAAAWNLKIDIDYFQRVLLQRPNFAITPLRRSPGLSFSEVHLGYQASIFFALAMIWSMVTRNWLYLLFGLAILLISSVTAGNRSPLLSIAVFALLYARSFFPRESIYLAPVALVILVPLIAWVLDVASAADIRAAQAVDPSSLGRLVLSYYGALLVQSNIFGHGLLYDSQLHWPQYWDLLRGFQNATIVQRYGLHNYSLNMLVMFGIFILPPLLLFTNSGRYLKIFMWAFVVYLVNTLTHNEGPFYGDNMFWYGAICVLFMAKNSNLEFNASLFQRRRPSEAHQ